MEARSSDTAAARSSRRCHNPDQRHIVIPEWVVPIRAGDTTIEATGQLLWIPGPSPYALDRPRRWPLRRHCRCRARPWSMATRRRRAPRRARRRRHDTRRRCRPRRRRRAGDTDRADLRRQLPLPRLAAGIAGAVLLLRDREEGVYAAAFAAIFIALNGGLSTSEKSVAPSSLRLARRTRPGRHRRQPRHRLRPPGGHCSPPHQAKAARARGV
jgi:hypothetical protein